MRFRISLAVATISGFIALSYEILWYRAYSFVSRGAPMAFGAMLGAYLLGIALGSLGTRWFCGQREAADPRQLRHLSAFVFLASAAGFLLVPAMSFLAVHVDWVYTFPLVLVAAGMFGAILPLVSHFGIPADDLAGSRLSYLYLGNIAGSASGSLLTGFVLMDLAPLAWISAGLTVLGLALALGLAWSSDVGPRGRRIAPGVFAAGVVATLALVGPLHDRLYERLQFKLEDDGSRFVQVQENRHGVITVTESGRIYGGGAYDGAFSTSLVEDLNWIVRCHAIPAFHPAPREVLVIGLSSGSWAQVIAHLPGVERVTIVEINPGYLELMDDHPDVASLLENDRVEIVIDDGRRWLARHPDRDFDLVVQNTTHHWRAHITNLLSVEYLDLVKDRLRPGGIFYYNTTWSTEAMRTALECFPHVLRVYNFLAVSGSPIEFDGERWIRWLREGAVDGRPIFDLAREADAKRFAEVSALAGRWGVEDEMLETRDSLEDRMSEARIITDDNMASEWKDG